MGGRGSRPQPTETIRIIDNTDHEKARELAQLEMQHRIEQERIAAENARQAENAKQQSIAQQKAAEEAAKKRKLLLESNLARIKEVQNYSLPSKLHVKNFPKGYNFGAWDKIRLVTIGATGCGKSSFIATLEKVIRQDLCAAQAQIQTAGGEGTVILQDYLCEYFWSILDTRGCWEFDTNEVQEMLAILDGKIKPGEYILRSADADSEMNSDQTQFNIRNAAPKSECVVAAIFVIKANDPLLHNSHMINSLTIIRNHFRMKGMTIITLVTHCDQIQSAKIPEALALASSATGSPRNLVFPIANYLPEHTEPNLEIEKQALDVLEAALLSAEQYIRICAQREALHTPTHTVQGSYVPQPSQPPQPPQPQPIVRLIVMNGSKAKIVEHPKTGSLEDLIQQIKREFQLSAEITIKRQGINIDNHNIGTLEPDDCLIVTLI